MMELETMFVIGATALPVVLPCYFIACGIFDFWDYREADKLWKYFLAPMVITACCVAWFVSLPMGAVALSAFGLVKLGRAIRKKME